MVQISSEKMFSATFSFILNLQVMADLSSSLKLHNGAVRKVFTITGRQVDENYFIFYMFDFR